MIVLDTDQRDPTWIIRGSQLDESKWRANVAKVDDAGSSFQHERDRGRGIKGIKLEESKENVAHDSRAISAAQGNSVSKTPKNDFHAVAPVANAKNLTVGAPLQGLSQVIEKRDPPLIRGSKLEESKTHITDESKANDVTQDGSSFEDRRFPTYGTAAFARQCPWTLQNPDKKRNCTILARPPPIGQEGISSWVAQIVAGRILAQQTGCDFFMDYAYTKRDDKLMDGVNVHEVLIPFVNRDSDHPPINWTVPSGYDCNADTQCFVAKTGYNRRGDALSNIENVVGTRNLSDTPMYRFGYGCKRNCLYANGFRDLESALPGFTVETGMACSLGNLFELAPTASQFEPELFSRILPTLHSKDSLVMSLYIRTGQTDVNTHQEERGGDMFAPENTTIHRNRADKILKCALYLEKQQSLERSYSRVVWMVVTDSQYLKQWITESYDTRNANTTTSDSSTTVRREIVTTQSRGVHTRSRRGPSTADFAEAMIDWYLIGESDLVVESSISFGATAALRTARPLYKPSYYNDNSDVCSRAILVHSSTRDNITVR
jgi:hypothetical protein